jgi:hypothetical protein
MQYFAQDKAAEAKFGRKGCLIKLLIHPDNRRLQKHPESARYYLGYLTSGKVEAPNNPALPQADRPLVTSNLAD